MHILLKLFILSSESSFCFGTMGEKHPPDSLGNFADKNSYVVGIPLSPSTLYVDHPSDNRSNIPPSDLGLRKRSGTSFQITSVTVQGSRLNNEDCEDSADDYDDSHTDDISSDILDSSRFTEQDGSQSEDNTNANSDDLSPCGPLIITPLPSTTNNNNTINVGLGIDMSPPFPAIGPSMVSSGVTMMTSSKESPVSAQVHPLPDNWQHRFKVVKIVSSEPFRRGRWLCMDFRDPPPPPGNNSVGGNINRNAVPAIQVTPSSQDVCPAIRNCQGDEQLTNANRSVAHVYEIPVSAAYATDVGTQHSQPLYGIFVPQNNINNNNVVNEISIVHQVPTSSMAPNQNAMQGTTYTSGAVPLPQNYPLVSQNAFRQAAAAPQQPVLDANANKVVPGYGAMNGHDQNATNFGYTGGARQVPDIRPVAPPPVADKAPPRNSHMDSAESAASSGASTVAIDNKIEQAMDLVKSHLMFAVREEVEVLKEKITELLERISQLEHENDILRANASPETLKQLNQSQKKFTSHSVIGKQQNVVSPHVQNQPPPS